MNILNIYFDFPNKTKLNTILIPGLKYSLLPWFDRASAVNLYVIKISFQVTRNFVLVSNIISRGMVWAGSDEYIHH